MVRFKTEIIIFSQRIYEIKKEKKRNREMIVIFLLTIS